MSSFTVLKCSVFLLCVAFCQAGDMDVEDAGDKQELELTPKAAEYMKSYQSSIKYWDTDNPAIRQSVLKDLSNPEELKIPGCPRIRYPVVCDNDKNLHENSCYFRMQRKERPGLLPVMVFTSTPIEIARQKCAKGL